MVAGLETGKMVLRHGRSKVVPAGFGEFQKLCGHHRANRVRAVILGACMTMSVAEESGCRIETAWLQRTTEHIARRLLAFIGGEITNGHKLYQPRMSENIKGATMVASDSTIYFGVFSESLPQVIFSFGTAPE